MAMMGDPIERLIREALRGVGDMRRGTVSAVDTTGANAIVTVEGQRMEALGTVPAVGDVVYWWNGPYPVVLGSPA